MTDRKWPNPNIEGNLLHKLVGAPADACAAADAAPSPSSESSLVLASLVLQCLHLQCTVTVSAGPPPGESKAWRARGSVEPGGERGALEIRASQPKTCRGHWQPEAPSFERFATRLKTQVRSQDSSKKSECRKRRQRPLFLVNLVSRLVISQRLKRAARRSGRTSTTPRGALLGRGPAATSLSLRGRRAKSPSTLKFLNKVSEIQFSKPLGENRDPPQTWRPAQAERAWCVTVKHCRPTSRTLATRRHPPPRLLLPVLPACRAQSPQQGKKKRNRKLKCGDKMWAWMETGKGRSVSRRQGGRRPGPRRWRGAPTRSRRFPGCRSNRTGPRR